MGTLRSVLTCHDLFRVELIIPSESPGGQGSAGAVNSSTRHPTGLSWSSECGSAHIWEAPELHMTISQIKPSNMVSDTLSNNGTEYFKLGLAQKIRDYVILKEYNFVLRLIGLFLELL